MICIQFTDKPNGRIERTSDGINEYTITFILKNVRDIINHYSFFDNTKILFVPSCDALRLSLFLGTFNYLRIWSLVGSKSEFFRWVDAGCAVVDTLVTAAHTWSKIWILQRIVSIHSRSLAVKQDTIWAKVGSRCIYLLLETRVWS